METVNFDKTLKFFCGTPGVPILMVLASYILTGSIVHGYYKEVDYSGSTKVVNQGDPFQIVCRLSRYHKLQWMKNEMPFSTDESSNGYLQIEEYDENNQEIYILRVKHAEPKHAGIYRCSSFSRDSHKLKVISLGDDKMTKFVVEPGDTLELKYGIPDTIAPRTWFKDGVEIVGDSFRKEIGLLGDTLTIRNVGYADAGMYKCTLRDIPLVSSSKGPFHVYFRTKVVPFPPEKVYLPGQNLTLSCNVYGYPVPSIRWYIGNIPVEREQKTDDRISILPDEETRYPSGVLQIINLNEGDTKIYTCLAKNTINEDKSSVKVIVQENMIRTNADSDTNRLLMTPGKTLQMYCNVMNHPDWEVDWFKNGLPINETDKVIKYRENNTLVIKRTMLDDAGNYSCVVTRDTQTISANINVVTNAIIQVALPKSMDLVQGDRLLLYCSAAGVPQPSITWFKD